MNVDGERPIAEEALPAAAGRLAERVAELRVALEHHAYRYYVLDDPEIGDEEYDHLIDELRALEAAHPELLSSDSPTQRVGAEPVSDLVKVRHPQPMLSLANARSADELQAWIQRMRNHLAREGIEHPDFEFVAEPKIDGLAMSLIYRDGLLERGATRGNGEVGEDVTHNLRTIAAIPLRLGIDRPPALVEVRGEVYMSLPDFAALNERRAQAGLSTFMNPRNSAAGTIRQLDPKLAAERPLSFWAYAIGATDGISFATHYEALEWLRAIASRCIPTSSSSGATPMWWHGAAPGKSGAARWSSKSMASWSRSTTSSCSGAWASSGANRAGRSPGSSRRRPPPQGCSDRLESRQVRGPAPVRDA